MHHTEAWTQCFFFFFFGLVWFWQTCLLFVFTVVLALAQVVLNIFFGALLVPETEAVAQHLLSFVLLKIATVWAASAQIHEGVSGISSDDYSVFLRSGNGHSPAPITSKQANKKVKKRGEKWQGKGNFSALIARSLAFLLVSF